MQYFLCTYRQNKHVFEIWFCNIEMKRYRILGIIIDFLVSCILKKPVNASLEMFGRKYEF